MISEISLIVKEIRSKKEKPIIGVIGATTPKPPYKSYQGIELGYTLRNYLKDNKGTIFTGGVEGVGVDVYNGIVKYVKNIEKNKQDKFFLLTPRTVTLPKDQGELLEKKVPYSIPRLYEILSKELGKNIENITAGEDMGERREYVAEVADVLIMLNGKFGTLEEAIFSLSLGKIVIPTMSTFGAAMTLYEVKENKYSMRKHLHLTNKNIDYDLIKPAKDVEESIRILDKILEENKARCLD